MLPTSRLYSFLDHKNGFNIHFLEGQKLIQDLAITHPMQGSGLAYFRDTFLGLMPLIFFLKPGESVGIYIDSNEPYFRLKIETNSAGHTRTLLLPEEFNSFPMALNGQARLTKIFQNQKNPYTSVVELNNVKTKDVINKILSESYQTNSEVIVGELSDQSIMVTKLPPINVNKDHDPTPSREEYIKTKSSFFHDVFEAAHSDIEIIVKTFEEQGLSYLGSRQVDFFCPCSHERIVLSLRGMYAKDLDELFQEDKEVEVKCDYCKTKYMVSRNDIVGN